MTAPQRTRGHYHVGRTGSWLAATVPQIDKALADLRRKMAAGTTTARQYELMRLDVDDLLDCRHQIRNG